MLQADKQIVFAGEAVDLAKKVVFGGARSAPTDVEDDKVFKHFILVQDRYLNIKEAIKASPWFLELIAKYSHYILIGLIFMVKVVFKK